MLKEFKERKRLLEEGTDKLLDELNKILNDFTDYVYELAKSSTEEDLKEFLSDEDELIDDDDKTLVISAFVDTHKDLKNIIVINRKEKETGIEETEIDE